MSLENVLESINRDTELWQDFITVCDCGGRRAGTPSEERSIAFAEQRLRAISDAVSVERVPYAGWRLERSSLALEDGRALACTPLLGSQSTTGPLTAEVCDLGRGTPEDFARRSSDVPGRVVLVRHEYPFSRQHIHRRRKLAWALERGAAGFIIANPHADAGPVAGSSGRGGAHGIPAIGTDFESAQHLVRAGVQGARICLEVAGEDYGGETSIFALDLPGKSPNWVVLSAHIDGHDLAESAMDNATGVAAALTIARVLKPLVSECPRGLRVCLFSAEEWALAGSKRYLDAMDESERNRIVLDINLDTIAGDHRLTALTSEFERLDTWVRECSDERALALSTHLPMMANSDHYNFAQHGIPALRLVAGFDRPECDIRYILTRGDTRDKVRAADLTAAVRVAATLVMLALTMSDAKAAALRA